MSLFMPGPLFFTDGPGGGGTDPAGIDVSLTCGLVRGVGPEERGVLAFTGTPYAAPPIGDLRWRSPRPLERWADVFVVAI